MILEESEEIISFDGGRWGWWFRFEMGHPRRGHFIDSPVAGLSVETPTYEGITGEDAAFDYFPGESVDISLGSIFLGSAVADHKISPLDIFSMADTEDNRVINMARLLQSLDVDGEPQGGINITPEVVDSFEQAMDDLYLIEIDFAYDYQVDAIIDSTISNALALDPQIVLLEQTAEDAKAHLDKSLNNSMFRKNISKTADLASSKAKMNIMPVWFPARKADGETIVIEYFDELDNSIRTATEAKPIIVTYTDADPETGAPDVWAAISRDDGNTWKLKNLSRSGDRSSFTLANGEPYYGATKKPVFQVKGNRILVAWSSKFAKGGKPGYAIKADDPLTEDVEESDDYPYPYDDPSYEDDIWGVAGPQRSHDYTDEGFPEVGEVPYTALWVCRGLILTDKELTTAVPFNDGTHTVGEIVWFKPERVTSGRRDVNQIFVGAASGAGFAMVWQEDPNGVKPGKAVGPGPGWGGATTSHKTDIWYSYLTWGNHSKVDTNFIAGGDPDHELDRFERPKALVPMSLLIRLSDNDVVNTDNIMVELDTSGYPVTGANGNYIPTTNPNAENVEADADGTHRYAYEISGLIDKDRNIELNGEPIVKDGWYEFTNNQDETKLVAVTTDGRLLDGDTGASRGNIFLQPYTNANGKKSAWAIIT